MQKAPLPQQRRLGTEVLEARILPAVFLVNATGDGGDASVDLGFGDGLCATIEGDCTLRAAIEEGNILGGAHTINFNIPGGGVKTLTPSTPYDLITSQVTIDGYTQPGSSPNTNPVGQGLNPVLLIEINGAGAGPGADGLYFTAGNSTVKGLVVNRFSRVGIILSGGGNNVIQGNFVGTDPTGTIARGNSDGGICITSSNDTIGGTAAADRNLVSGNAPDGICLFGANSLVQGNLIGTTVAGTSALGNAANGIIIAFGGTTNTIGGLTLSAANVISGNGVDGIIVSGPGSNLIQGNKMGTDITGELSVPNSQNGITVMGSPNNTIGGINAGSNPLDIQLALGNLISGNTGNGIKIANSTASGNLVQGNFIGLNDDGDKPLGNMQNGIFISDAPSNTIGFRPPGAGDSDTVMNVVSANQGNGIKIFGSAAASNRVSGIHIGTNLAGTAVDSAGNDLGNQANGVFIVDAPSNEITTSTTDVGAVISGNNENGIYIMGSTAAANKVNKSSIGTNKSGQLDFGNTLDGIRIESAPGTQIQNNNIAGNDQNGVRILGALAKQNAVESNLIGISAIIRNEVDGVLIETSASENTIGGSTTGKRNYIIGNAGNGIQISGASKNVVTSNNIGLNAAPNVVANGLNGILITGAATENTIGGSTATVGEAPGNVIAGNTNDGIEISGIGTVQNLVVGNLIGLKPAGEAQGNGSDGVEIVNASNNTIGGSTAGSRNIISANLNTGVFISGATATGNVVQGNSIGTDATGTLDRGNVSFGVNIESSASNQIGGLGLTDGNLISGNGNTGVRLSGANSNVVQGNLIGVDVSGGLALGNGNQGLRIDNATENVVQANVIAANASAGIRLGSANINTIRGNFIGTDSTTLLTLGNGSHGILIASGSSNNNIGAGLLFTDGNTIAHNDGAGVMVDPAFGAGTGNLFASNSIFSNATLGIDLGADGVTLNDNGDADTGSNNLQNYPVLLSAVNDATNTTISGILRSVPGSYTVELFTNSVCDLSGFGEGQTLFGSFPVVVGAGGSESFEVAFLAALLPVGTIITVTAINDATLDTSEFSECIVVITEDQFSTIDYGDAPDPSYPTLLVSNGARHVIAGGLFLGAAIDADLNGQPNATATGDDTAGVPDDEDGVVFTSSLVTGELATLTVTASAAGFLDAWVDFNDDGDWIDAGEQVFTSRALVASANSLSFDVPGGATVTDQTFARFRFSSAGGLLPTGLAINGEVEDYEVSIESPPSILLDYGDAPDPTYPTLFGSDGARHVLGSGLFLGSSVDSDANGQPNATATGDDTAGVPDDEDGVVFTSALLVGDTTTLTVTASTAGKLDAWIDFNADGDWADAGEQIFTSRTLLAGANSLSFSIPSTVTTGDTYARFRFSSTGELLPTSLAADGEVEDYLITITADVATCTDDDGDIVTIKVKGAAFIATEDCSITIEGSVSASVSIKVKAGPIGDGIVLVNEITSDGPLKSIKSGARLQDIFVAGAVGSVRAPGLQDDAVWNIAGALGSAKLGGNVTGAVIAAAALGKFQLGGNLADSWLLIGTFLGSDNAFGGDDDTFDMGTLGSFKITGAVTDSVVGVGLDFGLDDAPKGGDDIIVGGAASSVGSFSTGGTVDADSYFRAGAWLKDPKISGVTINPLTDPRFLDA